MRERLSNLRVADLRTLLRDFGAPLSGKKLELVDRLVPILQENDQVSRCSFSALSFCFLPFLFGTKGGGGGGERGLQC